LVIFGERDELVPVARSRAALEAGFARDRRHRHEFRVFEGASHDIETPDGAVVPEYLTLMTSWARARFDEPH
jgi:acetyl esterase/lipase